MGGPGMGMMGPGMGMMGPGIMGMPGMGMGPPGHSHMPESMRPMSPHQKPSIASNLLKPPPEVRPAAQQQRGSAPAPSPPSSASAVRAAAAGVAGGTQAGPQAGLETIADPSIRAEVAYIERVRATCGILNIGCASEFTRNRPDLTAAAFMSARNRSAFRPNAYADEVSRYLPPPPQAKPASQGGPSAPPAAPIATQG
mmetsp:Transcript_10190/g.17748  ORF Transcript_10190/g.17748 Transcript_10190/m.17748 type:complete len:198 (-) Transcript_10190:336-929(-)